MLKSINLFSLLHATTGVDTDEIALCARRLREAGLFVRETRSEGSARATPRQITHLLILLLTEEPAVRAAKTIERANKLTIEQDSLKHFGHWTPPTEDFRLFGREHSFVDAVEHLLKRAIANPHEFRGDRDNYYGYTSIKFNRSIFSATIYLQYIDSDLPGILRSADVKPLDVTLHYSSNDWNIASPPPKHLTRESVMNTSLLAEIGEAIARAKEG